MATITWLDKVDGSDAGDPQKNVNAADMNLIKTVVNTNDGNTTTVATNLSTHAALTNNPHSVTKTQVGLSNVTNEAQLPLTLTANKEVTGDFALSLGTNANHLDSLYVYTETQLFLHAQDDLTINVHAAVGTDVVGVQVTPKQVAIAAGFANSTTVYIRDEDSSNGFEVITNDGSIVLTAAAGFNITLTADNITLTGTLTNFVDNEVPSGAINGINTAYTIANTPVAGFKLFWNGMKLKEGTGFTRSGANITMAVAPETGDTLECDYRK